MGAGGLPARYGLLWGRVVWCGAAYTVPRHLPLAFVSGGLASPHCLGRVCSSKRCLYRGGLHRELFFRACTHTADVHTAPAVAAASAADAAAVATALSIRPGTTAAAAGTGASWTAPPRSSLGVPVIMSTKKTDVIALFDVDGTLTKPRLVRCCPNAMRQGGGGWSIGEMSGRGTLQRDNTMGHVWPRTTAPWRGVHCESGWGVPRWGMVGPSGGEWGG